jgi:hypothetical protein
MTGKKRGRPSPAPFRFFPLLASLDCFAILFDDISAAPARMQHNNMQCKHTTTKKKTRPKYRLPIRRRPLSHIDYFGTRTNRAALSVTKHREQAPWLDISRSSPPSPTAPEHRRPNRFATAVNF